MEDGAELLVEEDLHQARSGVASPVTHEPVIGGVLAPGARAVERLLEREAFQRAVIVRVGLELEERQRAEVLRVGHVGRQEVLHAGRLAGVGDLLLLRRQALPPAPVFLKIKSADADDRQDQQRG